MCSEHKSKAEKLKEVLGLSPVKVIPGSSSPVSSNNKGNRRKHKIPQKLSVKQLPTHVQVPDIAHRVLTTSEERPNSNTIPDLPVAIAKSSTATAISQSSVQSPTTMLKQTTPTSSPPISPMIPILKMPEIVKKTRATASKQHSCVSLLSSESESDDSNHRDRPPLTPDHPLSDTAKYHIPLTCNSEEHPPSTDTTSCTTSLVQQPSFLSGIKSFQQSPSPTLLTSTPNCAVSTINASNTRISPSLEVMETGEQSHPLISPPLVPKLVTQSTLSEQLTELNKREEKVVRRS